MTPQEFIAKWQRANLSERSRELAAKNAKNHENGNIQRPPSGWT
jgi:hypothetical protein